MLSPVLGLVAAALLVLSPAALGEFEIAAFDGDVTADPSGAAFTQAGGHPYSASTYIDFTMKRNPNVDPPDGWPDEPVKTTIVELPPGLVGDPSGVGRCTMFELGGTEQNNGGPVCPTSSQVGTITVRSNLGFPFPIPFNGIYLMEPPPDVPVRFGMNIFGTIVVLDASLRSDGDYGATVTGRNVGEGIPITGITATLWGVPADPRHDAERYCLDANGQGFAGCSSQAALKPFLRLPTRCTAPGEGLVTTLRADSWFDPGDFKSASFESHLPPGLLSNPPEPDPGAWGPPQGTTNCDAVPFEPSFVAQPATPARAGAPSGFEFDLNLPQGTNPNIPGQGDLKKVVVTFPEGVRVSPPSADGLAGCSPAQVGLRSLADARCPDASKFGSVKLTTPLLEEPLEGAIYLATPFENPFRSLIATYIVVKGPGLIIKLPGRVETDPVSGQIRTTFDDNPQAPFSKLHLELFGGSRAALVLPRRCGTYTTRAVLTSWSGKTVTSESSFTLSRDGSGAPCPPQRFAPFFDAGVENPVAGEFSPFNVWVVRDEEDDELRSLSVHTAPGVTAKLKGVPLCGSDAAARGTCGEGSRIGSVTVGAGAGSTPFFIESGRVHLTEGYKGGDFGLSIVVPAVAGPFDLGDVVVRSAIHVDPHTAALRVVSDPLPQILQGIPLQTRDVRVRIDRPRFTRNPTSCLERAMRATAVSTGGLRADLENRFEVGECDRLGLRPRMRMSVGARGRTGRGASVPFTTRLTRGRGQANLRSVSVSLPTVLNARLPVVNDACTIAQFEANDCERARTGTAIVETPLLDEPLQGGAYFVRRASGRGLPNLVIALRGQVDVDLVGTVIIPATNQLSTTFRSAPDVPFTSFALRLVAGRNGALGAAANLCSRRARRAKATVHYAAHNGRELTVRQRLSIRGCRR